MITTINPEMLVLARESRGLTQSELAEAVSITQGNISRYESGLLIPSDEHFQQLASALDYPAEFFFQMDRVYGFGSTCIYHRKRQSLPIMELRTIQAKINILRIQISRLLMGAEVETENRFYPLDVEEHGTPERVAALVRGAWGLPSGPIKHLVSSIEHAGGVVLLCSFETRKLDAISQWPPGQPPMFFLNVDAPTDRQRFSLAHELGHVIMHKVPTDDMERQADRFAAEFLAPAREIAPELSGATLAKLAAMKPYWKMSMAALARRASDLGRISPWQYRNLNMQLGQLGHRTQEPVELPPEEPTVLRDLINVYVGDLKYSTSELCRLLAVHEHELRAQYFSDRKNRLRVVG